jgi:hypothetical protein
MDITYHLTRSPLRRLRETSATAVSDLRLLLEPLVLRRGCGGGEPFDVLGKVRTVALVHHGEQLEHLPVHVLGAAVRPGLPACGDHDETLQTGIRVGDLVGV